MRYPLSVKSKSVETSGIPRDYKEALCEYVWNGFEANATTISITHTINVLGGMGQKGQKGQNRTDPEQQNLFLPSRACFYYSHSLVVISFPSLNRNTTRSSAWTVTWSTVPFQSFSSKVSGNASSSPNSNIMPPMAMASAFSFSLCRCSAASLASVSSKRRHKSA